MRLLVFTSTFPTFLEADGTANFVYEYCKALKETNPKLDIYVLTPRRPGTSVYQKIDNLTIIRFPYFLKPSFELLNQGALLPNIKKNKFLIFQLPFLFLFGLIYLIKVVKQYNISAIHAHWIVPAGFISAIYKHIFNKNIKLIITAHGSDVHSLNGKFWSLIKKFVINKSDKLVVVSKYLGQLLIEQGISSKKIAGIIPMGIDLQKFNPINNQDFQESNMFLSRPVLLYVGRLSYEKGVDLLIHSMPQILEVFPCATLLIIGDGPYKDELKLIISQLGLSKNIKLLGPRSNASLGGFYQSADLFVGPSRKESFGIVFLEALINGCFVVSTKTGGIPDIIDDDRLGVLADLNVADLADKIIEALKHKDLKDNVEYRKNSVKSRFSWEIIAKKYLSILFD